MHKKISLKNQIINHTIKFSLGTAISGLGQFVNEYFVAFFLGPAIFGTWQAVKLVLFYGNFSGFGSIEGLYRETPLLRGQGKREEISKIKNISFVFNFATTLLLSFLLFSSTFFIKTNSNIILCLRFVSLLILIQFVKTFCEMWLKANNQFDVLSRIAVAEGVGLAVSVILVFFFSLFGFLLGYTINLFCVTLYSYWKSSLFPVFQWDWAIFKGLIRIGFPIMLIGLSSAFFQTVDRFLILKFFDLKFLGFYSLGWLAFLPAMFIFYAAGSVLYPRFAERYGKTGKDSDLKKFIVLPLRILSLLIPILLGAIAVILPILVRFFLPAYTEGIAAARVLFFGLFFVATVNIIGNFFLATNRQNVYLKILFGSVLINFFLGWMLIKNGFGIFGVAMSTSVAYFIFFLAMIIAALIYCGDGLKEIIKFLLEILLPLFYVIIVSLLTMKFFNFSGSGFLNLLENAFLKEFIFLMLCFFSIYLFFKKHYLILWKK